MCGHCENAVKTALEAVEGVETVTADAKAGTATIRLQPGTSEEALAEAVKKAGYVPHGFAGEDGAGAVDNGLTKTVKIDGMMCEHCEKAVTTALSAVEGVESVKADAKAGTAIITVKSGTDEGAIEAAVVKAGYVFLGIE